MSKTNGNIQRLLETRDMINIMFNDYIVQQNKTFSENNSKEIDYLDIMLDIEDKIFPQVAASLQKLHIKAVRKKFSGKNEEEEEETHCEVVD